MELRAEKYQLQLDYNELWDIAFDTLHSLQNTIDNHWINHQQVWEQHEERRLCRLKKFFMCLGRIELYDEVFDYATKSFDKHNKKEA